MHIFTNLHGSFAFFFFFVDCYQMALVSQEPVLFARSIYDNIVYGEKGLTQEQVIQASKDANAHNFIDGLSKKYDTDAGEFGTQLSGIPTICCSNLDRILSA